MDFDNRMNRARHWLWWVLGAAYLLDVVTTVLPQLVWDPVAAGYPLVAPLPLVGAALLAVRRPVVGAALAAVGWPLLATTDQQGPDFGLAAGFGVTSVPLSAALATGAVVALVVARLPRRPAAVGVVVVVVATTVGVWIRATALDRLGGVVAESAVVLLAAAFAVAAGLELRRGALGPARWPLPLGLGILVLLDVGRVVALADDGPRGAGPLLPLLVCLGVISTGVVALLSVRNPVRAALGAAGIVAVVIYACPHLGDGPLRFLSPYSVVVAHLVLVVRLGREAPPRAGVLVGGALLGIDLVGAVLAVFDLAAGPGARAFLATWLVLLLCGLGGDRKSVV